MVKLVMLYKRVFWRTVCLKFTQPVPPFDTREPSTGAGRAGFPSRGRYPLVWPKLPQQQNNLCNLPNDVWAGSERLHSIIDLTFPFLPVAKVYPLVRSFL